MIRLTQVQILLHCLLIWVKKFSTKILPQIKCRLYRHFDQKLGVGSKSDVVLTVRVPL